MICKYCGRECTEMAAGEGLCNDPHCIEQFNADPETRNWYPEPEKDPGEYDIDDVIDELE